MSEVETRGTRRSDRGTSPLFAAIVSAFFALLITILAFSIMVAELRGLVRNDIEAFAAFMTGDRHGSNSESHFHANNPILSFHDRSTAFPAGDADACVDMLVAWYLDHAVDDAGPAPGPARALATAICHGTKVAVARGDGANVLDVMLVVDRPTHDRQVVSLSVIEGSLDTLDFMWSSWRQIALALSIAGFAGVFAYLLRLRIYRAYVEASGRASTDGLSGLMRREEFMTVFEHAMRQIRGGSGFASLLVIDIDHFKAINDRFGHAAGDEVIRQVGHLIGSTLRGGDSVGRTGGEEFMVFLPSLPKYVAAEVADRLRKRMAAYAFTFGGQTFFVTISIGVASVMPSDSVQSVSERADRRLYQAKRKGRNCVIWEDDDNHDF